MAEEIRIGTSGWNYDHWRGRFYPPELVAKRWFSFYAEHFNTVEINNTFYKQPNDATFDQWQEQASPGFLFSVKANRYLTHMRKLKEPAKPLERFLSGVRRLKSHLGPILYQLPPNWKPNLERLREFAQVLPDDLTHVLEFRRRDWLTEETYDVMAECNLSLCVHDLLPRHPRRVRGRVVYVRFHGAGSKYAGKYRRSRLRRWADWLRAVAQERKVFVYFNNDLHAHAVHDAKTLQDLLAE